MLLSIIIPVQDVAAYLLQCLDSFLGVNFQDCEILLAMGRRRTAAMRFLPTTAAAFPTSECLPKQEKGRLTPGIAPCGRRENISCLRLIGGVLGKLESPITHVTDRKGHDMRCAIAPAFIHSELGGLPEARLADSSQKTIQWYLDNREWWEAIVSGEYQSYYGRMYGNR